MRVKDVILTLERFAPLPLQDSYDNAGLQIGQTEAEVSGVLLCLDVTEDVVREAVSLSANMIVAHHPLLFHPLRHIAGGSTAERATSLAIKHDIAIYAAHTNLDNAEGGVNYRIAAKLGAKVLSFLRPISENAGSGVIAALSEPLTPEQLLEEVSSTFRVESLCHNDYRGGSPISRIAICGGAGGFLLRDAIARDCQAFLTGEIGYHDYFGHEDEIMILEAGHYQSEQYTIDLLGDIISGAHPALPVFRTKIDTNPIKYYTKWQEKKRQSKEK